jgi:hypothetical protein
MGKKVAQIRESVDRLPLQVAELADFIQDLNIFLRQLSLYPADHPQLEASCDTALNSLARSCRKSAMINLGIAPANILFDGSWLDGNNIAIKNFAAFLTGLNIASISFHNDLSRDELIRFCQLLNSVSEQGISGANLPQQLERNAIGNIQIVPIDFSAFLADSEEEEESNSDPWGDFLKQLLGKQLPEKGAVDIATIARSLNQEVPIPGRYDQLIATLLAGTATEETQHGDVAELLVELVKQLNPKLRQCFTQSTLRALEHQPGQAAPILQAFPQQLLEDALRQQSSSQGNISSRLVDLLGQFSRNESTTRSRKAAITQTADNTILRARIDILLLEDNHSEYVPSVYQETLQRILNGQVKGTVPAPLASELRDRLEQQSVEQQCANVIFNMLDNGVDPKAEATIQTNLTELARFFLDTGDFNALRDVFVRWSHYLYSGQANARFLDETVLATQTSEQFMSNVLDCVEIWGESKNTEICSYILEVGEPYAELLIERLGSEEQMARRKIWIGLLERLGRKGVQLISKTLQDERWYLVRNLLLILSHQERELIPIKAVRPLTSHKHPKVRQEALRILFRFDPLMANRQLLKELSSGDKGAICATLEIAALSSDDKVLKQLHQLLQLKHEHDPDLQIRRKTLEALSLLGKPQTIPLLAHLLHKKLIRSRKQKQLQQEIIKTLGRYPAHSASPLLNSLCNGRDRIQRELAQEQLQYLRKSGES